MAKILILGGGFGGVVAAERLARAVGREHQITLISRSPRFVFYPALVRLAFGQCEPDDVSFDLSEAMHGRRVRFMQGEIARVHPAERKVTVVGAEFTGDVTYDYLVFALGRRLATEQVPGFFEHSNHLLGVEAALKFRSALDEFTAGHAVIGYCPGTRLVVPVYETAFALARRFEARGERAAGRITVVVPDASTELLGGPEAERALQRSIVKHGIEVRTDFPVARVNARQIVSAAHEAIGFDLLMLLPPFRGAPPVAGKGLTDGEGFLRVDAGMRVAGVDQMYAIGDCVNLPGPKMGHNAVLQGEVAAANIAHELAGRAASERYYHELTFVVDEGGAGSVYLHKELWDDAPDRVREGRFWHWAKLLHEKYWNRHHA